MDLQTIKALFQQSEIFRHLDETQVSILIENGHFKHIPRGKILYRKGEESDNTFCFILSGVVHIVAKDGHVVREMRQSEIVGEIALSDPHHARTLTVITKEPTEVFEWNINHIKEKIPGIWKNLLKLAWKNISNYYED